MSQPATIVIPLLRQVDAWLAQCVRSAVTQSHPTEVIVVRSELTPSSNLQVLDELGRAHSNLQVLVEDRAGSFPGAINQGIRRASSDRVGLLLSDDWLETEAVAESIREAADIVSSGNTVHFADGRLNERASKDASIAAFEACATLEAKAAYLEHFFLFRRERILAAGGLDESIGNFPGIDDYDLIWTLLERGATVRIVNKRLYNYRDHDGERLTLQCPELMLRNLRKIFHKHGMRGSEADRLVRQRARWFGHPIYRVLNNGGDAIPFDAICAFATRLGLKRFLLQGSHPKEYIAAQTEIVAGYRDTGRQIYEATDRKGRPRIRAPFSSIGDVICTQPERVDSFFWCFDALRSGYVRAHLPTPFGPKKIFLIPQLGRNAFKRLGWAETERPAWRSTIKELAAPRTPSYTPSKRILMITSTFGRGGNERQLIATSRGLVARGYDVRILALGAIAPDAPTIEHEIRKLSIEPEYHTSFLPRDELCQRSCFDADPLLTIYKLPSWFSTRAAVVGAAIRHHRPAVVHCWLEMPGIVAALAACALGVPRVILGQRNALAHMDGAGYTPAIKDLLAVAYPVLAANPNAIILNNSASEARNYEARYGLARNSIRVIYNAVTPEAHRIPAANEVAEFCRHCSVGDNPIVGTLMQFVRNKDPQLWIEVAKEVAAMKPQVRFLLCGHGELKVNVADHIKALGLTDRVTLRGPIEDVALFYAIVDVVLLTSLAEGTPNVLIEAQAAGRPVVAPKVGGIAETMANGLSGRLVTSRSPKHLAKAVLAVLDDREWRRNAAIHGPSFVADRFGAERMIRETLEIYGRME